MALRNENEGRGRWSTLASLNAVRLGMGASAKEIAQLERDFQVLLPADYTDFLLKCGFAELPTGTILGMGGDVPETASVRGEMEAIRRVPQARRTEWAVPIYNVGNGDIVYLETSLETYEGQCAVCVWEHELNSHRVVELSFEAWILRAMATPGLVPPFVLPD